MTDVDTGSGPFPTAAMISGGGYVHKSAAASANAVRYAMAADSRAVIWAIEPGTHNSTTLRVSNLRGFGDPIALAPSGDAWSTFLSLVHSSSASQLETGTISGGPASSNTIGAVVSPKAFSGLGSALVQNASPFTGAATGVSGGDTTLGTAPSNVAGKLYLSRLFIRSQVAGEGPRAIVPGAVFVPQSGTVSLLSAHDLLPGSGEWAGRLLLAIATGAGSSTAPAGIAFIDITGPWR